MSESTPIEIRGLSKVYRTGFTQARKVQALSGLDLTLQPGTVYGLLGPNGAGKSTTIKITMGLVQASAGTALIFGRPPSDPRSREKLGFVPENPAPYEYLTGREFMEMSAALVGLSPAEGRARSSELLEQLDLQRAERLLIRKYSKGMVQRVALAQALLGRPRLLILDEPTSGLDPVGRSQIRDLIAAERARGTTILFCTHIISDVEAVCDRVGVLVRGQLVREGTVSELVSSQTSVLEISIEGVGLERLTEAMGKPLQARVAADGRLLVQVEVADRERFLGIVLQRGGRVLSLQGARFSLEDLFHQALSEDASRREAA